MNVMLGSSASNNDAVPAYLILLPVDLIRFEKS